MIFLFTHVFLAPALACGTPPDVSVVGWAPDGRALVRTQHNDDSGELHALELSLMGGKEVQSWTILTPEDDGDRSVRGARWKKAEAELAAMGVVVRPEMPIVDLEQGITLDDSTVLTVRRREMKLNDVAVDLVASRGDQAVVVDQLYAGASAQSQYMLGPGYLAPNGQALVVEAFSMHGVWHTHVPRSKVESALATPSAECQFPTQRRIVGWGPGGAVLVRAETERHAPQGTALCSLVLEGYSAGELKRWDVVRNTDKDPDSSRKARWKSVESALKTDGWSVVADPKPFRQLHGKRVGSLGSVALPGRPYAVTLTASKPAKGESVGDLVATLQFGGRPVGAPTVVGQIDPYFRVHDLYTSPKLQTLVLTESPDYGEPPVVIGLAALDAIWEASRR